MKGGFLIAADLDLYQRASRVLVEVGATTGSDPLSGGVVQYTDEYRRHFTLYERLPEGTEWEVREGDFKGAEGVEMPNMRTVDACPFECRWPDLVARLASAIARATDKPTWLMDGDGVIWNSLAVDPAKVRL